MVLVLVKLRQLESFRITDFSRVYLTISIWVMRASMKRVAVDRFLTSGLTLSLTLTGTLTLTRLTLTQP